MATEIEILRAEVDRLVALSKSAAPPEVKGPWSYVYMLLALTLLGIFAVFLVMILRPEGDNTQFYAAISAILVPTCGTLIGLMHKDTHLMMNSRLTQMVASVRKSAEQEGAERGREEGKKAAEDRADAREARTLMESDAREARAEERGSTHNEPEHESTDAPKGPAKSDQPVIGLDVNVELKHKPKK